LVTKRKKNTAKNKARKASESRTSVVNAQARQQSQLPPTDGLLDLRRRIAEFPPGQADISVYIQLFETLAKQGRTEEAIQPLEKLVVNEPKNAQAQYLLASSLCEAGEYLKARAACKLAIKLETGESVDMLYALSNICLRLVSYCKPVKPEWIKECADAAERVVELVPSHRAAWNVLSVLYASYAMWEKRNRMVPQIKQMLAIGQEFICFPFYELCCDAYSRAEYMQMGFYAALCEFYDALAKPPMVGVRQTLKRKHKLLRIGFLSADLREHPMSFLISGLLERLHERGKVAVYLYALNHNEGEMRKRLKKGACSKFTVVQEMSDEDAAKCIAADEIDILFDLMGYTNKARLYIVARRPAPMIINWIGYPGSIGHARMADYILGDAIVTPFEHAGEYSESIIQLPYCYMPFDDKCQRGPCPTRKEAGLPVDENIVVLGNFAQVIRVTDKRFDTWCKIMHAVPNSILWLLECNPTASENVRREFADRGLPQSRLIFAPSVQHGEHMNRIGLIDLALDTFPYTSHTTAMDMLWAGVPLLTRLGDHFSSRVAASILYNCGLGDLITTSEKEYLTKVIALASDREKLKSLRERVGRQIKSTPLFDTTGFACDMEKMLHAVFKFHMSGNKQAIRIKADPERNYPGLLDRTGIPQCLLSANVNGASAETGKLFDQAHAAWLNNDLKVAEHGFRLVLDDMPTHRYALNLLGMLLAKTKRCREAIPLLRRAIGLYEEASTLSNLGAALAAEQAFSEATVHYKRAVELEPKHAGAWCNLGNHLLRMNDIEGAEKAYRTALKLKADFIDAIFNLMVLLDRNKRYSEAIEQGEKLLQIEPDNSRCRTLLLNMRRTMCDWRGYAEAEAIWTQDLAKLDAELPFYLLHNHRITRAEINRLTHGHVQEGLSHLLALPPLHAAPRVEDGRQLRVGMLSADFGEHPVGRLLVWVLKELRTLDSCEIILYELAERRDEINRQLRANCHRYVDLKTYKDKIVAQLIADDRVDILIDLMGFTRNSKNGVMAYRPAPVQVNWIGYAGTLGDPRLADYVVGDRVVTPLEHGADYSETLALMPHCYLPVSLYEAEDNLSPPDRASEGLPSEGLVLCCMNQPVKINPRMFGLWCDLLKELPDSVIWLSHKNDDEICDNLRKEAVARGVESERLIFARWCETQAEHHARLRLADFALDTYPYNSHSTAADALLAGIPIVTLMGEAFASRVAASLLHVIGLPELVARSDEEYYQLALNLAQNRERLKSLRSRIGELRHTSPLFDMRLFARDFNRLLHRMYENHTRGIKSPIVLVHEDEDHEASGEQPSINKDSVSVPAPGSGTQSELLAAASDLQQGRYAEAEASMREVLERQANNFDALNILAISLLGQGNKREAEARLRQALDIREEKQTLSNLAVLLKDSGRFEESIACHLRILDLYPDDVEIIMRVVVMLNSEQRYARLANILHKVVQDARAENKTALLVEYGCALFRLRRTQEAEKAFREALQCATGKEEEKRAREWLADTLVFAARMNEALPEFEKLLADDPENSSWIHKVAIIRRHLCDWRDPESLSRYDAWQREHYLEKEGSGKIGPWSFNFSPNFNRKDLLSANAKYAKFIMRDFADKSPQLGRIAKKHAKLRVGMVSFDLGQHPVGYILDGHLRELAKHGECEVWLYALRRFEAGSIDDMVGQRLRMHSHAYVDLEGLNDVEAASRIAGDELDILVDLAGHTRGSRCGIMMRRPAPVLVSWLGYACTLGHRQLADYLIGDGVVTPLEHAADYSESLALMPHCFLPVVKYEGTSDSPNASRAGQGLPQDALVLCCMSQTVKITPQIFDLWCAIMRAVPDSVLWLAYLKEDVLEANLRYQAVERGVSAERIIFAPWCKTLEEHQARLHLADLALDTFPYNAHSTGTDMLLAGVPMVTRKGETFVSRVAASLLQTLGMPELIAHNDEQYLGLAVELAQNRQRLGAMRQRLGELRQTSPLFDSARFARDFSRMLHRIRDNHVAAIRGPIVLPTQELTPDMPPPLPFDLPSEVDWPMVEAFNSDNSGHCEQLGDLLLGQNMPQESAAAYLRAASLNPDQSGGSLSRLEGFNAHYATWQHLNEYKDHLQALVAANVPANYSLPVLLNLPDYDRYQLLHFARLRALYEFADYLHAPALGDQHRRKANSPMRVAFLLDMSAHAIVQRLLSVLPGLHQRGRVAAWVYAFGEADVELQQSLVANCTRFVPLVGATATSAAQMIADDNIDILVDMLGHMQGANLRITAQRPSPVQVNWMGYSGSLGHPRLADYIIGDHILTPLEYADSYSEKLALMPNCFQPEKWMESPGQAMSVTEAGLPASAANKLLLACDCRPERINPQRFTTWCKLLHAVPDSILLLLSNNDAANTHIRGEFVAHGLESSRLFFFPYLPWREHLRRLAVVDLGLDSFPHSSHAACVDFIRAGVPLVTRSGENHASRIAASLLITAGLAELVTGSEEAYLQKLIALASDRGELAKLRARVQTQVQASPLYDIEGFGLDLERMFGLVWQNHARGSLQAISLHRSEPEQQAVI